MKLGFNLLLWTIHVTDEHLGILQKLKDTGYDGAEIPMFGGDPAHYRDLGRKIADLGLEATGVGVMPGGGKSAISPVAAERQAGLDHLKWLIDCTEALGGKLLCGPFHQPLGEFSGQPPSPAELQWLAEVQKSAALYAASAGIDLAIEPLNRFECYILNTAAAAAALTAAVGEPNYGYLYDTFHFNIEEKSVAGVIEQTAAAIKHVHISENTRGVPGEGHVDFDAVFRALRKVGYDGWMTVEAFGSALPDLAAATKIWRPLFDSPQAVYEGGFRLMRDGWDRSADSR
ncbi:MAG: sugar phosphate isomerase/epimerase [bacterium]